MRLSADGRFGHCDIWAVVTNAAMNLFWKYACEFSVLLGLYEWNEIATLR